MFRLRYLAAGPSRPDGSRIREEEMKIPSSGQQLFHAARQTVGLAAVVAMQVVGAVAIRVADMASRTVQRLEE